jgi:multidrug transporter EmrE-like cation transporter
MRTPFLSIVLFVVASLLGAAGQFLYKSGAEAATSSVSGYLANWRILLGVLCYTAVMVLFVAAFRIGGELQVLYPVYATTFVWAAFIALAVYGAPIRPIHIAGMLLLITGMYCMGR